MRSHSYQTIALIALARIIPITQLILTPTTLAVATPAAIVVVAVVSVAVLAAVAAAAQTGNTLVRLSNVGFNYLGCLLSAILGLDLRL